MINIIDLKNIKIKENSIILIPSYCELYYKEKYINNNYKFYTIKNFLIKNYNGSKKLASNYEELIIMYETLKKVLNSLNYFKDLNDSFFINELLSSYNDFNNYELKDNEKNKDLSIIYKEYENILLEKGFINEKLLLNDIIENNILDKDYLFLNFSSFNNDEIKLIKSMIIKGNVTIGVKNNNTLIKEELKDLNPDVLIKGNYQNDKKEILFKNLNDVSDEVKFIDNDISKKIMEGACYDDFLIVSNSIDEYYPYFDILLNHPYSKKIYKGVLTDRFIKLFFKILKGDFSCENFINLLKLGIFDIDARQIDELDNYIYSYNLYNQNFYDPFIYNPSADKKYFSKEDEVLLKKLNEIRENIINPIRYLLENVINVKDKTEILKYLYTYFKEEKIIENLFKMDEYGCKKFIDLFDMIHENLSDIVCFEEIINLFNMFDLTSAKEENMQNSISISNLNSAVYEDKKYIYLIGATNDSLPKDFKLNGLINSFDIEKDNLINKLKDYYDIQNYLFNNALYNNEVIITYPKLGTDLKLKTPSLYLEGLDKKEIIHDKLYNKNLILNDYSLKLSSNNIKKEQGDLFNKINDSNEHNLNYSISLKNAEKLYGETLNLTPSKIEVYSKCPFYFFCEYGLKLNVKEQHIFDNREVGSLVHFILEKIISNDLNEISIENLEEFVFKYAYMYLEENGKVINNTIKYVVNRLCQSTTLVVKNIINEQEISKFKPKYFEFKINEESVIKPFSIPLDKGTLKVSGIIDRVDVCEDDTNYYYRIVDYKTGDKKFRLDDILDSLNLQMLLYLLILKKNAKILTNKKVVASALLYYPALVKESISSRSLNEEEKQKSISDKLRMNGIVCKDSNVISNLGEDEIGNFISVTSRGKLNEENLYGLDDLSLIFESIEKSLKEIGNDILSGNINVNPIGGRNDACSYCKFNSICKFDSSFDKKRKPYNLKNSEVLKMLEGDNNA